MTVTPLEPDTPIQERDDIAPPVPGDAPAFESMLKRALELPGVALERAATAERAFVSGQGGLQEMMLERAQADIFLSLATTAASKTAQAVSTVLGMQV